MGIRGSRWLQRGSAVLSGVVGCVQFDPAHEQSRPGTREDRDNALARQVGPSIAARCSSKLVSRGSDMRGRRPQPAAGGHRRHRATRPNAGPPPRGSRRRELSALEPWPRRCPGSTARPCGHRNPAADIHVPWRDRDPSVVDVSVPVVATEPPVCWVLKTVGGRRGAGGRGSAGRSNGARNDRIDDLPGGWRGGHQLFGTANVPVFRWAQQGDDQSALAFAGQHGTVNDDRPGSASPSWQAQVGCPGRCTGQVDRLDRPPWPFV
jgi:hypothetical protein